MKAQAPRQSVGRRRPQRPRMPDAEVRQWADRANDRHLISDIIKRHTNLKKRGPREVVGLCCFHSEKSPSLEVNDAKGRYYCHGCGEGGDAIRFLRKKEGMTFWQALEHLLGDELPVISPEERARRKAEDERLTAERIALGRSIWAKSVPPQGTPAEVYAHSRGIIAPLPPTVRFVMTPRWRDPETGEVGRDYPAMACALQDVTGSIVGVQCVFLMDGGRRKYERIRNDGTKAKAKLTFGQLVGSAFRLGPATEHVTVSEGPEDSLTLAQLMPGRTIWCSCGTANLWQVEFPPEVRSVCFAGDNNAAGRAAVVSAREAALALGLAATDMFPDQRFKDFNDELRGIAS